MSPNYQFDYDNITWYTITNNDNNNNNNMKFWKLTVWQPPQVLRGSVLRGLPAGIPRDYIYIYIYIYTHINNICMYIYIYIYIYIHYARRGSDPKPPRGPPSRGRANRADSKGFPSIVREFLLDKGASFLVRDSFYSNGFPSIVMRAARK